MIRNSSKGQGIVMLTLALVVLIAGAGLVLDIANLYFNFMRLQQGADASALAGANFLPAQPDLAKATARTFAPINGIGAGEVESVDIAPDGLSITMAASRTVPMFLLGVVGLLNAPIKVNATAAVHNVGRAEGIVPVAVDYRTGLTFGDLVSLKNVLIGPGNWAALALGGSGGATYESNWENGYSVSMSIGDMVVTEPGNVVGPTQHGVNFRIAKGLVFDPAGTPSSHRPDDPRVILVPMGDFSGVQGRSEITIKGFAEMWLVSVNGGTISAIFLQQVAPNSEPGQEVPGFGAFSPALIK